MCSLTGLFYSGVRLPLCPQWVRTDVVTPVCVVHTLSWNCLILWRGCVPCILFENFGLFALRIFSGILRSSVGISHFCCICCHVFSHIGSSVWCLLFCMLFLYVYA
jgi:hypothetical protein